MADFVAIGLRGLAFAAALQAAGAALFVWRFGGRLDRASSSIHRFAIGSAATALALGFAHALVEPTRLTGELASAFDGSLHALLLASDGGTAVAFRFFGLALILAGLLRRTSAPQALTLIGATLTAVSFTLTGHTATDDGRWLLAPLLFAHVIVVAFWFGALRPLLTATQLETPAVAGQLVEAFSRLAVRLVPFILVAGVIVAGLLLPDLASLGSAYGRILIAKLAAFAVLLGLASANRWRFGPGVSRGDRRAAAAFRLTVRTEWFLILAVIVATAAMTALFSPTH